MNEKDKTIIKIKKKSFKNPVVVMACIMTMLMPTFKVFAQAVQTPIPLPQDVRLTAMIANTEKEGTLALKKTPDEKAETLFTYFNGTKVYITEETSDQWLKVHIGDDQNGISGYMHRDALALTFAQEDEKAKLDTGNMKEYVTLNKNWKLYSTQDEKGAHTVYMPRDTFFVIGTNENWWHVLAHTPFSEDMISGFIPAKNKFLSFTRALVNNANDNDRLHLREEPSSKSASKGKYYNGAEVFLLEYDKSQDWAKVMIPVSGENKGYMGYMNPKFLATGPARDSVKEAFYVVKVNNSGESKNLKLRATPSEKGNTIATYANGTKVEVIGLTPSWYHVKVEDEVGFMLAKYIDSEIPFDYGK